MTCHLINKAAVKQNCFLKQLNNAHLLEKKAAFSSFV